MGPLTLKPFLLISVNKDWSSISSGKFRNLVIEWISLIYDSSGQVVRAFLDDLLIQGLFFRRKGTGVMQTLLQSIEKYFKFI